MPGERVDGEYRLSAAVWGGAAMSRAPSSIYIIGCPKDSS